MRRARRNMNFLFFFPYLHSIASVNNNILYDGGYIGFALPSRAVCVRDALWILMPSQKCPWGVKEENTQHYYGSESYTPLGESECASRLFLPLMVASKRV